MTLCGRGDYLSWVKSEASRALFFVYDVFSANEIVKRFMLRDFESVVLFWSNKERLIFCECPKKTIS